MFQISQEDNKTKVKVVIIKFPHIDIVVLLIACINIILIFLMKREWDGIVACDESV